MASSFGRKESTSARADSGGAGEHRGGDGTLKELQFLEPATLTMMATRRSTQPYGLGGGEAGASGRQATRQPGQEWQEQPGSFTTAMAAGSTLRLETPGGGGWGATPRAGGEAP